ncbi:toll-like receptor 2 [Parambassis ranga]|uniref:Toll-like receptor 2 n=1 Tax=Parambassis ranga TaxID=210632 RepID=A0A6P7KGL8_9TELE|nr:toll-like receptor 2 [Parambassis ranga]
MAPVYVKCEARNLHDPCKIRIMTSLIFVLLLLSRSVSLLRQQCHHCEQTFCNCSRQNLRKVPAAPPKLLNGLDVSFNQMEEIENSDFLAYVNLRSLIMHNNRIKQIHGEAFVPLIHLEKLDLSSNQLEMLSPIWFKNLFCLQYLNLLGNKYTTLGSGNLFQPLRGLKTLHVGGPFLVSVSRNDFSGLIGLEELFFDGRNLQEYTGGSLREIRPISHVILGLNEPFLRDQKLAEAILLDAAHPNTTLTFTDTSFLTDSQVIPLNVVFNLGTTGVIFKNVNMSVAACMSLLTLLSKSSVSMLALEDTQFLKTPVGGSRVPVRLDSIRSVIVKNVEIAWFYSFPALILMQPLLRGVRQVSVIKSTLFAIPCAASTHLINLEFLDISDNIISDFALREMMCDGSGVLCNLQTINISRNHLHSIDSHLFTKLEKLKNIDMSGNMFSLMPEACQWPPNLQFLNLSSSHLTTATRCLPVTLQVLDLSRNKLTVFNIDLPFLTELHISENMIGSLPSGCLYPHLVFLSIQENNVQTFSSSELHDFKVLETLEASGNPYVCSCDFAAFMTSDQISLVTIRDDVRSYICDSPGAVRGQRVVGVRLSVFECHTALSFSLLCTGILALCLLTAGLCHKFSVVWYMRMTWAWLRAKSKPKLKKGVLHYDAFVSYSEMDSAWVEAHLVPTLEQSEPPVRLCLHKRDFVPGGWVLDNIMDAIEKSHTTLFILSQNFVRSEWCKYELNYTHFRLFDQNNDTVVLILLEPIDKKNIPKRFCRLRRVMNSRTYLEWPHDENQIPAFWQSLRAAIRRPEVVNDNTRNNNAG